MRWYVGLATGPRHIKHAPNTSTKYRTTTTSALVFGFRRGGCSLSKARTHMQQAGRLNLKDREVTSITRQSAKKAAIPPNFIETTHSTHICKLSPDRSTIGVCAAEIVERAVLLCLHANVSTCLSAIWYTHHLEGPFRIKVAHIW